MTWVHKQAGQGPGPRLAVDEARHGPSRFPVFEPTLTAAEISEVEHQCGVALPDGYRSFLMEVGSGGPGPAPFVETEDWPARQQEILRTAGHEPTHPGPQQRPPSRLRPSIRRPRHQHLAPHPRPRRNPHQQQRLRNDHLAHPHRPPPRRTPPPRLRHQPALRATL
ncbi:SMI1/KNR4 family protein [Catenulispora yoronensis]|uniref:SMI1/KNR4 family protein n=1 Tax=Catenulispora yoronensis TaxID=450799 RepID=UPI0031D17C01